MPIFESNQENICKNKKKCPSSIIWDVSDHKYYNQCNNCQGQGGWNNHIPLRDLHGKIALHTPDGSVFLWDNCIK